MNLSAITVVSDGEITFICAIFATGFVAAFVARVLFKNRAVLLLGWAVLWAACLFGYLYLENRIWKADIESQERAVAQDAERNAREIEAETAARTTPPPKPGDWMWQQSGRPLDRQPSRY